MRFDLSFCCDRIQRAVAWLKDKRARSPGNFAMSASGREGPPLSMNSQLSTVNPNIRSNHQVTVT
jgi:hypothetical protein